MSQTVSAVGDYDFIFKIVLIGDSSVGKSNLLLRFTRNEFRLGTQSTIGVEFAYKQVVVDQKKIKTQVWDTAGQERFKTVIPQFYRGSEGALVVFDLTNPKSFYHVTTWVDEVHQHAPPNLPIVLVGNKSDLVDQRKVSREEATGLAQQLNLSYVETSALNASNVEEAFVLLVTSIYQRKALQSVATKSFTASTSSTDQVPEPSTKPVEQESSVTLDKPIRVTNGKKSGSTGKKSNGCCVIQ